MAEEANKDAPKSSIVTKVQSGADKLAGWTLLAPGEIAGAANRLSGRTLTWIGIGLAGVILLSLNIISSAVFKNATTDLTASGLYTISDSTTRVLGKIKEPIEVRVYFSDRLGEISALHKRYFERVRGLFERYQNITGGLLNVKFVDPKPFSDAEDRAVAAGLNGVRIGTEGEKGYFGLVATNSTDDQEIVPFFAPQREAFLEYDMTKLVHKLASPKKPVIGIISGVSINGGMTPQRQQMKPWLIMSQIKEFFDVEMLTQSVKEIPAKVDVLMLVHPIALGDQAAYAIDQFALKGGRVLAFIDPVSELGAMTNPMMAGGGIKTNPDLDKLLTAWGVKFDSKHVVGDIANARRVQAGGANGIVSDYVAWQEIKPAGFAAGEVIADGVKLMNIATPGHFEAIKGAQTKLQPIIQTSKSAMLIDGSKFLGQPDPVGMLRDYVAGGKSYILAARVTGDIKTAFPDGRPKTAEEKKKEAEAKKKAEADKKGDGKAAAASTADKPKEAKSADKPADAKKPEKPEQQQLKSGKINAILVGDSDMLYDDFWVTVRDMFGQQMLMPNSSNAVFVMNALENLSGGEALSGLRGRGVDDRPFEMVNEIRRESERKFRRSEQTLMAKLKGLQERLANVGQQTGKDGTVSLALTDKDKEAVEAAREEMIKTRQELRNVKHALRADIENLEGWVKFINIALVPLLIGAGGLAFAAYRRRSAET